MSVQAVGVAAARETLVTATDPMATLWAGLFHDILTAGRELRWLGDGPGIGRDARIAYSSLLGRYLARSYLTEYEGVRVLVPLDVARRCLAGTQFSIGRAPHYAGHEADWVGFDDDGLVIVEAKGTFNNARDRWHGPQSTPPILHTAMSQAKNTEVFDRNQSVPAKRWAIASRWGTELNRRDPTLIASLEYDAEERLQYDGDLANLHEYLIRADVDGVMRGLGHAQPESSRLIRFQFRNRQIGPDFGALVGPFGVRSLPFEGVGRQVEAARDLGLNISVVSMSSRYYAMARESPSQLDELERDDGFGQRFGRRHGLTVTWPDLGADSVPTRFE